MTISAGPPAARWRDLGLMAWLCAEEVGAVPCFDASRLARNGRDWHHRLELCGLVEARVIDMDGVYDPCRPDDRLLLGMKGSISEFEFGVLRARMLDAARAKARRDELRISVAIGDIWHREIGLGFDPDCRVQEVVRLIFTRFRKLGSARQAMLSMRGRGPLSAAVRRQEARQLRVDTDLRVPVERDHGFRWKMIT
jgi:DNA invertase Pin-like site-specific DNA recombinase